MHSGTQGSTREAPEDQAWEAERSRYLPDIRLFLVFGLDVVLVGCLGCPPVPCTNCEDFYVDLKSDTTASPQTCTRRRQQKSGDFQQGGRQKISPAIQTRIMAFQWNASKTENSSLTLFQAAGRFTQIVLTASLTGFACLVLAKPARRKMAEVK
jgi:hypothetical protein